jgi:hypothetical protein
MRILWCACLFAGIAFPRTEFWAPINPPRAFYSADVKFDPATSRLEGAETIRFRNNSARPIGRLQLRWFGDPPAVEVGGQPLHPPQKVDQRNYLFDLPADLAPGSEVTLTVRFSASWPMDKTTSSAITSFITPQLSWGFGTLDDYEVRLAAPDGYVWASSGRYDPGKRAYIAERARSFGAFLGKGYESAEADGGGVQVRAVFTPQGRTCAELLLKTAVDAIGFYRERFGMYPHRSLSIVPGMDFPAGGYPPATALVVVHGQHRFAERPEAFWRWITAHEIGHMYWGDYVLAQGSDSLSWLMIGMGIRADQEYRRSRNITGAGNLEADYGNGVRQGRDTTIDITDEKRSAIRWDFNNIVKHGKSIAMFNALESVVGRETFDAAYRRVLSDYAGKRLGWRDLQRVVESASGIDLDWFFESWVRSSDSVFYRVASKEVAPGVDDYTVRVERVGQMGMPITVAVRFEDGTEQRARVERLAAIDELHFRSKSPLRDVILDPDHNVVMAEAPTAALRALTSKLQALPWTGAGDDALEIYRQPDRSKLDNSGTFKLALLLYDGRHYTEALEVLKTDRTFASLVWQGHLLDLLGRRPEALAAYQAALHVPGEPKMRHDQYSMTIDKAWVEERLKTPFERK